MPYPDHFGELAYNHGNKTTFLSKSAGLLRAVAKQFPDCDTQVRKNPAGIAVGGDVYLSANDAEHGVLVTITHSPISSQRKDGVICYLQKRIRDHKGKFTVCPVNEPNVYLSEISAEQITAAVRRLLAA